MKPQTIALIGLIVFLEALIIYFGGLIYFTDIRGASVGTLNILTYQLIREVKGHYLTGPPTLNLFNLSILLVLFVDGILVVWKILSMRYRRRVRSKGGDLGKDAFLDAGEATFGE